jgi:hypothetical protein
MPIPSVNKKRLSPGLASVAQIRCINADSGEEHSELKQAVRGVPPAT